MGFNCNDFIGGCGLLGDMAALMARGFLPENGTVIFLWCRNLGNPDGEERLDGTDCVDHLEYFFRL